jgi:hypothetical protein
MIRAPPRFSFALRCPSQFPDSTRPRNNGARIGMVNKVSGNCLNPIDAEQLRGVGLEFWQLQDRDLRAIIHSPVSIPQCGIETSALDSGGNVMLRFLAMKPGPTPMTGGIRELALCTSKKAAVPHPGPPWVRVLPGHGPVCVHCLPAQFEQDGRSGSQPERRSHCGSGCPGLRSAAARLPAHPRRSRVQIRFTQESALRDHEVPLN